MTISKNKVVTLTYELRTDNAKGELIEKVEQESPFTFLFGAGNLLDEFEGNLANKKTGEVFEFGIKSENAYGTFNPDAIVEIPKNVFVIDGKLAEDLLVVGNTIPMQDQEGNPLQGTVLEIEEEAVKIDFNHPMAGKDLHFKGEILDLREATPEEITDGQVKE